MTYISERGEFETFQIMRAAYLESKDGADYWLDPGPFGDNDWTPESLHASDVGGCPRAVMYRLLDTPKKPRGKSSKANRRIMFTAAYRFHWLQYSALNWAGLLVACEEEVTLPDGWTGRYDATIKTPEGPILYDMKSVLPNALKYAYDMPRQKDCLQLSVYGDAIGITTGIIEAADRAGSNTPKECLIDLSDYVAEKSLRMQVLEKARDALPELPPVLGQTYVPHYTRDGDNMILKTVSIETPWTCGYCDYHLTQEERRVNPASGRMKKYGWTQAESTCKPFNAPPVDVAELMLGGILKSCKTGHEGQVEGLIATTPLSYYAPQEEE